MSAEDVVRETRSDDACNRLREGILSSESAPGAVLRQAIPAGTAGEASDPREGRRRPGRDVPASGRPQTSGERAAWTAGTPGVVVGRQAIRLAGRPDRMTLRTPRDGPPWRRGDPHTQQGAHGMHRYVGTGVSAMAATRLGRTSDRAG